MRGKKDRTASQVVDLEVDAYDAGLQFAYDKDNLPEALYPTSDLKCTKISELPGHDVIIKKQRGTTLRLSIALGLSVVFAIVAGALAATMAMQLRASKRQFGMCPTTNDQTNNTNASTTMIPTSDCKTSTSNYNAIVSSASNNLYFNLYCNANRPDGDLMSVWVYTFEDCIRACSSYDLTTTHNGSYCYGISYMYTLIENQPLVGSNGGNCWLKALKYSEDAMVGDVGVDSAFLVHE